MILQELIPRYHFSEKHSAMTGADAHSLYRSVVALDLSRSAVVRLLYFLRRMPRTSLTLAGMTSVGFKVLGSEEDRELVIGVIGRFWKPVPLLLDVPPASFSSFDEKGYAKAALNYLIEETGSGCRLSTETRIYCTSAGALAGFAAYWALIRPFSGLIRRAMLREILRNAEQDTAGPGGRIDGPKD
jgi:hypothetical protein